ncbi:hypothetical protein SLEP1_g35481 [Rubroshorea leprosula]|uniref:Uncharacterized protein n=1 Tax=Rubroshorea leprosula TaxID=152421 RepID=A0AAV5KNB0_9ROSI|nr:hypothetical protein SLEP1_g35481 [Rubroshorea leprosula]
MFQALFHLFQRDPVSLTTFYLIEKTNNVFQVPKYMVLIRFCLSSQVHRIYSVPA